MPTQLSDIQASLGESPTWHPIDKCLYWIDALAPCVYRLDQVTGAVQRFMLPAGVGCIAPRHPHGLIVWMGNAVWQWAPEAGVLQPLTEPLFAIDSGLRCNDGKCDRFGRFYMGSVCTDWDKPNACLYRVDHDGTVSTLVTGLQISNGLGWSLDNKYFYHCDSGPKFCKIMRYDFDAATGAIANGVDWFMAEQPNTSPDGLTVDSEGCIWTAVWGANEVLRLDENANVVQRIAMLVKMPTSCILGGEDYKTLFITSMSRDVGEAENIALPNGCLYSETVSVPGVPEGVWGLAK